MNDGDEWAAISRRIGIEPGALRLIHQVHGTAVVRARAAGGIPVPRPQADVVISDDPDVAIAVRVADCAPILLWDRDLGAVGAVHAGWRGTMQGAAPAAVRAMSEAFGSRAASLVAAIGPCLGPCCGEVGPEVVEQFRGAGHAEPDLRRWFTSGPTERPYLNLWAANRDQLVDAGVPPAQVRVAELCTRTHASLFHSYRAQGAQAGRMAGVIRAGRSTRTDGRVQNNSA